MRVHSSYPLGTHTIHIEAPELPGDAASAVKLTLGKTSVLVSVSLEPVDRQKTGSSQLLVNFSRAPEARTSGDAPHRASTEEADQRLTELIRNVVSAVAPDSLTQRMTILARLLSDNAETTIDVAVLQALGAALHRLKVLKSPLATAIRAAYVDSSLVLMPSKAQQAASDFHLLAVFTREGLVLLQAQARDVPHAWLIGAVEQVRTRLSPAYQAVESMDDHAASNRADAQPIGMAPRALDQFSSSVARAVLAASQFSSSSARRMAMQAISTHWKTRLQAQGQRTELAQMECTLKRMERHSMRQRLLTGIHRLDGRSDHTPCLMEMQLQSQVDGRNAVLIHSGRSQTCITAAPNYAPDGSGEHKEMALFMQDVFLQFNPTSVEGQKIHALSGPSNQSLSGSASGFFPFISMALEPVMQPRLRVAAYAKPPPQQTEATLPASAMTGVGGACMALVSAGAPISAWVAGVDLGMMVQGDTGVVLVDPLACEEALLDASMKVAGTYHGLTAVQLLSSTPGIPLGMLEAAMAQALDVRRHRISEMRRSLETAPTATERPNPYSMTTIIDPGLTHEIMVRRRDALVKVCESTNAGIHVDGSGLVTITAPSSKLLNRAFRHFSALATDAMKTGNTVEAVVTEVIEYFGVRLTTRDGNSALLHTSRMAPTTLNQGLDVGDTLQVRLLGRDLLGSYTAEMPAEAAHQASESASRI